MRNTAAKLSYKAFIKKSSGNTKRRCCLEPDPSPKYRSSHRRCSIKKNSQNSQENTCARASFLIKLQSETCNFIKKRTLAQVLSCEFCEIFKNTFFTEHLWWQLLKVNVQLRRITELQCYFNSLVGLTH